MSYINRLALLCLAALTVSSSASSAPLASASSSASLPPADLADLTGADIPQTRSKAPTQKEWADAKEYAAPTAYNCKLRLLREWLSMSCVDYFAAGLVAGDPKDVTVTGVGVMFGMGQDQAKESRVTAIFPIERGKTRIISFANSSGPNPNTVDDVSGGDYTPMMAGEGPVVQVWWRDGQANPSIVITSGGEP